MNIALLKQKLNSLIEEWEKVLGRIHIHLLDDNNNITKKIKASKFGFQFENKKGNLELNIYIKRGS